MYKFFKCKSKKCADAYDLIEKKILRSVDNASSEALRPAAPNCQQTLEEDSFFVSNSELNFILLLMDKLQIDFKKDRYFVENALSHLLSGAHLKFEDDGEIYEELVLNFKNSLSKRNSSHFSLAQQYSFSGPVVKEILIGVSEEGGHKTTWIQFENHNTKNVIEFILHLLDYLKYVLTGKNIGPYGSSKHTDSNPILITKI